MDQPVKMLLLDANLVDREWQMLSKMLDPALKYAVGRIDSADVLAAVKGGTSMLLAVMLNGRMSALLVVEGNQYPRRRVFNVALCAGSDLSTWAPQIWVQLQQFAISLGFDQIEVTGRPGWIKFLPGAKEVYRGCVMDLNPNLVIAEAS